MRYQNNDEKTCDEDFPDQDEIDGAENICWVIIAFKRAYAAPFRLFISLNYILLWILKEFHGPFFVLFSKQAQAHPDFILKHALDEESQPNYHQNGLDPDKDSEPAEHTFVGFEAREDQID